ncbi:hypothetical protein D3C72_1920930 [compost metagenome]
MRPQRWQLLAQVVLFGIDAVVVRGQSDHLHRGLLLDVGRQGNVLVQVCKVAPVKPDLAHEQRAVAHLAVLRWRDAKAIPERAREALLRLVARRERNVEHA